MSSLFTLRHAGALAALAGALAAAPAGAHVPGVGNGLAPTTEGPDLRSVTVTGTTKNAARFCFDEPVTRAGAGIPASFRVRSYDAKRYWVGQSVDNDASSTSCVVASFGAGAELTQGTVGEVVDTGAVLAARNSLPSYPSSEPLGGSVVTPRAGATSGPDLVQVEPQGGGTLLFHYDEPIVVPADLPENRAKFQLEDQVGQRLISATKLTAVPAARNVVEATFPAEAVGGAQMALSSAGAVSDIAATVGGATPSPAGEINIDGRNPANAGSGIVPSEAWRESPQVVAVKFNGKTVNAVAAAEFWAYSESGEQLSTRDIKLNSTQTVAYIDFGARFAEQPDAWTAVTIGPLGFQNNGAYGVGRTLPLGTANSRPGFTSGPDLLAASIDGNQNAVYTFDEEVYRAPSFNSRGSLFFLQPLSAFQPSAQGADGPPSRLSNTSQVRVHHTGAAAQSNGAAVTGWSATNLDTITDGLGYPTPTGSVSYETEKAPVLPAAPAEPAPVVTPAPPLPGVNFTLVRKKLKKTKKQKYVVKYSGRLTSTSAGCIGKRSITFEARRKSGTVKSLGKATSNSRGAFALALKKRPKGRVYAIVAATPTCAGTTLGGIAA